MCLKIERYPQFIQDDQLQSMYKELHSGSQWTWRQRFWRYYLVDGLSNYQEHDPGSWYHYQYKAMSSMSPLWQTLFDRVSTLAGPGWVLMRYALTGQTQNQFPQLHRDVSPDLTGNFRSYLFYLNDQWELDWGGATEFVEQGQVVHREWPEPGKMVQFDSQMLHIGLPPSKPDVLRITLVIHGQLIV